MTNNELNNIFLDYTRKHITPSYKEWAFVSDKYKQLINLLEDKNVFQSGSCARFTAIKPINDLDVVWIISDNIQKAINSESLNLEDILQDLASKLESEYKKIRVAVNVKPQTHSVGIYFGETEREFSIDIVPAKKTGLKNEFGYDILEIPEDTDKEILWKKSDPRGYREEIKRAHDENNNLRKVIRFIKKWRWSCKNNYPDFPLKSFHLELIVNDIFMNNAELNFLEGIESFYKSLSGYLHEPIFVDRADENNFIDEYVDEISEFDKNEILELSELALSRLNDIKSQSNNRNFDKDIDLMLSARDDEEKFIFDDDLSYKVILNEDLNLKINGKVVIKNLKKNDSLREYYLRDNYNRPISVGNEIYFYISDDNDVARFTNKNVNYYWKVKNRGKNIINKEGKRDHRGEITFNQTAGNPEATAYNGIHFVECYAISNNKCIAYDRIYIYIKKN